jgi:hypothetical protein
MLSPFCTSHITIGHTRSSQSLTVLTSCCLVAAFKGEVRVCREIDRDRYS